jgi:hypothetical protein
VPILAALLAVLGSASRTQAESPQHDSAVEQVSYTTSQSGASLEWRSFRSTRNQPDRQVMSARQSNASASNGVVQAQHTSDPFSDPFGDGRPRMLPAVQTGQVSAKALREVSSDALPEFPSNGSAPMPERPVISRSSRSLPPSAPDVNGEEPRSRTAEEELAAVREDLRGKCPSAEKVPPIADIKLWTRPTDGTVPPECRLGDKEYAGRSFAPITYTWKASALCHKPLVFEEPQLERYGHSLRPIFQPVCSAAHFFMCVPAMPYILGVETPNECVYTLGYYRPGSCAPYTLDPLPLSIRGFLFEGAAIAGFIWLLP